MLCISTHVVATMPLTMVRHPEILRFAVMSIFGLIKVDKVMPLPVLHPSGIISSNQVMLAHKKIFPLLANQIILLIS